MQASVSCMTHPAYGVSASSRVAWRGCSFFSSRLSGPRPCSSWHATLARPQFRVQAVSQSDRPAQEPSADDAAASPAPQKQRPRQPKRSSKAGSAPSTWPATATRQGKGSSNSNRSSDGGRPGRGSATGGRTQGSSSDSASEASPTFPRAKHPRQQQQQQQQQPPKQQSKGKQQSGPSADASLETGPPPRFTDRIRDQTSLDGLLDLMQGSSPDNFIHVNAALQWLFVNPREHPRSPEQLAAVVQQLVKGVVIVQLPARNCASIAYYCSKLGYVEDLGLYRALLQRFMVVKGEAKPRGASNLVYALGTREQLQGLLEQGVLVNLLLQLQQADDANAQDVANALWAAAKCEPGDSSQLGQVVAQLLGRFVKQLGAAKPQEVSNTLYALAALPRAWPMDSALQLVERLVQLLPRAQPQEVSNVLWALGRYVEHGWLAPLSEQPHARLQSAVTEFTSALAASSRLVQPQHVSNSLRGVAMLQAQVDWGVVGQLLGRVTQEEATTQELANACWGVAKLQQLHDAPPGQQQAWQAPFSGVVAAFVPQLPQADPQAVANMVWACGAVRHYPPQLLHALTAAPLLQMQQASPQAVSNMALPVTVLAPDPPPAALLGLLLQRMQELLAQQPAAIINQNLANTAWAMAVLDQQQLAVQLKVMAAAAFSQQCWACSQAEALSQWHQVQLWLTDTQVLGPAGLGPFPGVSQQQLEKCRAAWEEVLAANATALQRQFQVCKVLRTMPGVEVVGMEQRDQHDGSRSIDIVAHYKDQLLAVEVDGPSHFTWPELRPTGLTLARNRALERRGYRVVCVPVDPGWAQQRGQQQRLQYLQGLLDTAVEQPADSPSQAAHAAGGSTPSNSQPQQGGNTLRRLADAARKQKQQQQQKTDTAPDSPTCT